MGSLMKIKMQAVAKPFKKTLQNAIIGAFCKPRKRKSGFKDAPIIKGMLKIKTSLLAFNFGTKSISNSNMANAHSIRRNLALNTLEKISLNASPEFCSCATFRVAVV